jgi:hypothetical protein
MEYRIGDFSGGVYLLIKNERVVYVGMSSNSVLGRISTHQLGSEKNFDSFSIPEKRKGETIPEQEKRLIKKYRPEYNIAHNPYPIKELTEREIGMLEFIAKSEDLDFLVTLVELSAKLSGVDTISEIARRNKISPNGVKASKCYRKIKIGKQMMAVKGIRDLGLPF